MILIFTVSLPQRSCVCPVADRTKYCSANDSSKNQKRCFMLQGTQPGTWQLHDGDADGEMDRHCLVTESNASRAQH